MNRLSTLTDASGATNYSYDTAGNQATVLDANQNTTTYQYDTLNRQVKVIYPDTTFSTTAYDILGRVTSKTDQAGEGARAYLSRETTRRMQQWLATAGIKEGAVHCPR